MNFIRYLPTSTFILIRNATEKWQKHGFEAIVMNENAFLRNFIFQYNNSTVWNFSFLRKKIKEGASELTLGVILFIIFFSL